MKKRFCIDCINEEMGIFDSTGIRRPEEKRWGADVFTIPYPEGWEPGVRVKDRSGNNGTIANFKNIQRSMSKYCGEFKLDRKSTRLNSSHIPLSRMPSSA